MATCRYILLLLLSVFFAVSSAMANNALLDHVNQVSKSMSALYMYGLSGGSKQFQSEFKHYQQQSLSSLKRFIAEDSTRRSELLNRWKKINNTFYNIQLSDR